MYEMWGVCMNDFTREELAVLKHSLNTNVDGYKDPGLLNKLQSMIDNYCEHEYVSPYYINGDDRHYQCEDCGINMCAKGVQDDE